MAKMDKEDLKHVIKRSRKLFKGEEIPKVHGYEGEVEELVIRQPGEIWTDKDGKEWKQIGANTKVRTDTLMDKVRKMTRTAPNCPKEVCTCDTTKFLDKRMVAMKGMCFDCVYEHEQTLREDGKYEDYEKKTILENEKSFLNDARIKMEESRNYITQDPKFLNEDGTLEKWNIPSKETLMKELESDLKQLNDRLVEIDSELEKFEGMEF
tara:strand:+ start:28259 stop:28885 length:627 start_codon:yes stop_codon:yes gene_type:complete